MVDTPRRVVVVTGLSGAGKASILRTLEDIGYQAIDNPPLDMMEDVVRHATSQLGCRIGIGIDARSIGFDATAILATLARMRGAGDVVPELVYAEAEEPILQRRFSETRRRHPLAGEGSVAEGIALERSLTTPLRQAADLVVDTTDLPLPELRRTIERYFADGSSRGGLAVTVMSFAFPAGLPREADMVFDARFLRNPHYVDALRPRTGLDPAVAAYVEEDPDYAEFAARIDGLVRFVLPRFVREGKKYATLAIGCTGGRHRSVHLVQHLARSVADQGWRVSTVHRELSGQDGLVGNNPGEGQQVKS